MVQATKKTHMQRSLYHRLNDWRISCFQDNIDSVLALRTTLLQNGWWETRKRLWYLLPGGQLIAESYVPLLNASFCVLDTASASLRKLTYSRQMLLATHLITTLLIQLVLVFVRLELVTATASAAAEDRCSETTDVKEYYFLEELPPTTIVGNLVEDCRLRSRSVGKFLIKF